MALYEITTEGSIRKRFVTESNEILNRYGSEPGERAMFEGMDEPGLSDADALEHGGNGAMQIRQLLCAIGAVTGAGRVIAHEPWPGGVTGLGFAELDLAA